MNRTAPARRCKAGQMAIVIKGPNAGKIVLVVKAMAVDSKWTMALVPWKVLAEGSPLDIYHPETGLWLGRSEVAHMDDSQLCPIEPDADSTDANEAQPRKVIRRKQKVVS